MRLYRAVKLGNKFFVQKKTMERSGDKWTNVDGCFNTEEQAIEEAKNLQQRLEQHVKLTILW